SIAYVIKIKHPFYYPLYAHTESGMRFDRLKELIGKREIFISLSTLDPAGLSVPADYADHEHTLFVTKPYASRCEFMFEDATEATGKEVKIWGTYVVQPPDESSIRIAVENLGIKRVIFFAENQSDLHEMEHIRKGLEKKGILNGTNASIVLPNHIKKKVTGF
ncbi:MAG: hypothetical protein M1569_03085, partial [Candidatus Marsarchaeota archaeon]|nr:hypothetical protein [Candidatus Marsarchaeota archaeon]